MNIDVDYGNSQALADLRAPADDFFCIGGWLAGDRLWRGSPLH